MTTSRPACIDCTHSEAQHFDGCMAKGCKCKRYRRPTAAAAPVAPVETLDEAFARVRRTNPKGVAGSRKDRSRPRAK